MTQNHHTQLPANAQTITFDAVSQSFPQSGKNTHEVLREVSFTAAAGEIISVIGASGCGKSTLAAGRRWTEPHYGRAGAHRQHPGERA